jgi:hypothetical protein
MDKVIIYAAEQKLRELERARESRWAAWSDLQTKANIEKSHIDSLDSQISRLQTALKAQKEAF